MAKRGSPTATRKKKKKNTAAPQESRKKKTEDREAREKYIMDGASAVCFLCHAPTNLLEHGGAA